MVACRQGGGCGCFRRDDPAAAGLFVDRDGRTQISDLHAGQAGRGGPDTGPGGRRPSGRGAAGRRRAQGQCRNDRPGAATSAPAAAVQHDVGLGRHHGRRAGQGQPRGFCLCAATARYPVWRVAPLRCAGGADLRPQRPGAQRIAAYRPEDPAAAVGRRQGRRSARQRFGHGQAGDRSGRQAGGDADPGQTG